MQNYVKDNRNGVITEITKYKPEVAVAKGIATMQLTNVETGAVDVEVRSENVIMDDIGKNAYNHSFYTRIAKMDGGTIEPFGAIHLTTWDKAEKANTPCFLGVRRGWANRDTEYVGTDKFKGTINKSESRNYVNQDGKFVTSMVFDWPTHAANGTFNSILWTPSDTPNLRSHTKRGSIWFAPMSIDPDIREYLNATGCSLSYDAKNEYLTIISSEQSNTTIPVTNPYKGSYSGFRFKKTSSELVDAVRYVDQEGNPMAMSPYTTRSMLSDGRTVYAYYYTSTNSSTRHKKDYYTIEVYNDEGVLINRKHIKVTGGFPNPDGIEYRNVTTTMEQDGTLIFRGYYKEPNVESYENVMIRYNPFTHSILETIYINKKIYIPHNVENIKSVRISNVTSSLNIVTFEFTYTLPNGTTDVFHSTYDQSDITNIKFLNDCNVATSTAQRSNQFTLMFTDYYMITTNGNSNSDNLWTSYGWRQSDRWGAPSAHTLLAAPVTKTQSHTMKVTYEIIVDTIDIFDITSFFNE